MSVDGSYKVTINSPMGARDVTLALAVDGDSVSGSLSGQDGEQDFSGGSVSGNDIKFAIDMTRPMPMKLEWAGTVDGDSISGTIQLGSFGEASFSGSRA